MFNQKLVMLIIFCVGKLTCKSFMSNVVILCWLLIWMLFRSCATYFEFSVAYVYGSFINWLSLLLRYLAVYKMVLVYYLLLVWWVCLICVFWSRHWVLVSWVLFAPNIFVTFVYCCLTFVHCLLNVFLKWLCGIFIQMYYLIFWYKGINLVFQCDYVLWP